MSVWLIIISMGLVTFGLRLAFILLVGRADVPRWLSGLLRFVPPVVLAALVFMEVFVREEGIALSPVSNTRIAAAAVAGVVAWRTRKVLPTIVIGMAALWALNAFIPGAQ